MVRPARTVLIVDDSQAIRRELSEEFMRNGFEFCAEAENGRAAIERVVSEAGYKKAVCSRILDSQNEFLYCLQQFLQHPRCERGNKSAKARCLNHSAFSRVPSIGLLGLQERARDGSVSVLISELSPSGASRD